MDSTGVLKSDFASLLPLLRHLNDMSSRSRMRTALQNFERRGGRGIRFFAPREEAQN
jgi:hypothetical protein